MGREVKRVALDFEWPLNEVWQGFLMPKDLHSIQCEECEGSGMNPATRQISKDWYDHDGFGTRWWYDYKTGLDGQPATRAPWKVFGESRTWSHDLTQDEVQALVDQGRLMDFTHTFVQGSGWVPKPGAPVPTAEEVNNWSHYGFGHDGINHHICTRQRATRLGVYGTCTHCNGEGYTYRDDAHRTASEGWEPTPPPEGPGWSMWENVSEGSPISPVFSTPEKLARWLWATGANSGAGSTCSYTQWLAMINAGYAPSMMGIAGQGLHSGVAAMAGSGANVAPLYVVLKTDKVVQPYTFEALLPEPDEDFHLWCDDRDIEYTMEEAPSCMILRGPLSEDQAMEFKLRWI